MARKLLISFAVILSLSGGSYIGYLSALVDLDEIAFIEQVKAVTDEQRLQKQLERSKSILDARTRAFIRKSQEFFEKQRQKNRELPELPKKPKRDEVQKTLQKIELQAPKLSLEEKAFYKTLKEQEKDLQFFDQEIEVIETMMERNRQKPPDEKEEHQIGRRRVTGTVNKLLQLKDKRKEIQQKRVLTKQGEVFWKEHPKEKPATIEISVESRDGLKRSLSDAHATQIATALAIMPQSFEGRLRQLYIVYGDSNMRRGLSGVGVVFMKGEEADFFRVLVHEFGHIYDLHREVAEGDKSQFYDGEYRLFQTDPSVSYYQISWKNTVDRSDELPAFASSYGMTDPFEDFAEAFALYVLQGETFRLWKSSQSELLKKYDFLADAFFDRVFVSSQAFSTRPFDVTMMPVDYEKLLKI